MLKDWPNDGWKRKGNNASLMEQLDCFIGKPLEVVKKELDNKGYNVIVKENSLSKIKTDYQLVVLAKKISETEIELIVGDFLINIENKIN